MCVYTHSLSPRSLDGRLHPFSVSLLSSCTSKSITSSNHFRFKERFVNLESLLHLCHHSSGSNSYYSSPGQLRQLPQLLFAMTVFTFSHALSLAREFFLKNNLYSIIAQHKACQEFPTIWQVASKHTHTALLLSHSNLPIWYTVFWPL